jgi:hypothetical protein
MCWTANAVENAVSVDHYEERDGIAVVCVAIDPDDPYGSFKKLPAAIEFKGRVFGKTAYNSDRNRAYYRTDANVARGIRG